jgi:hypothetical protein
MTIFPKTLAALKEAASGHRSMTAATRSIGPSATL